MKSEHLPGEAGSQPGKKELSEVKSAPQGSEVQGHGRRMLRFTEEDRRTPNKDAMDTAQEEVAGRGSFEKGSNSQGAYGRRAKKGHCAWRSKG